MPEYKLIQKKKKKKKKKRKDPVPGRTGEHKGRNETKASEIL
jgi:hypothetical protein